MRPRVGVEQRFHSEDSLQAQQVTVRQGHHRSSPRKNSEGQKNRQVLGELTLCRNSGDGGSAPTLGLCRWFLAQTQCL